MLSEAQFKTAKPKGKKYLLNDGSGIYLRVDPSGRKYWILRYRENERERQLLLGVYPDVSLNEARKKRKAR